MLRHVLILARDQTSTAVAVTIALDRHLSRGEQVEIVHDRRGAGGETPAARWPVRQERRRPSPLADQLRAQGYALVSREDEAQAPANQTAPRPTSAPPPAPPASLAAPGPRIFERKLAERNFARPPLAREERPRLSLDDRQALREGLNEDWSADPDGRDDFVGPRRRGGLVAVLIVAAALGAGLVLFSTHARDRLVSAVLPVPPPVETASPADPATPTDPTKPTDPTARPGSAVEEPARAESRAPESSTPTRLPSAPSAAASSSAPPWGSTAPSATPSTPPSAPQDDAPADAAAPAPSAPASLPPRRAEAPAPERSPDPAPPPVRSQRLAEFPGLPRVEVSRASSSDITTFTVRLTDPRGRPLPDAQVWLRQKSTDGFVRETPLEPISPAGSYRGAVAGGTRRADQLTVRVELGDRRMEMPLAE